MRLAEKVAIVTGAGGGIGRAAVKLFLREGAYVVAGSREPDVYSLSDEAGDRALRLAPVRMDVCDEEQVRALVRLAVERFGGVDILLNNAGIEIGGPATGITADEWQRVFDANARGVFFCCKHAIPEMLRRGKGSIVNNASINGIRGNYNLAAYSASKGAVVSLTHALAIEYAQRNIRVNCLCPGTIEDTGLVQRKLAAAENPDEVRAALTSKHPIGRLGHAEEVAYAALFLASDEASFITGVALPVDGGRSIR